jgi:DNA mismatch repair protein MutS2
LRVAERELREHLRLLRETQSAGAADRVKAAAKKLGDLSAEHLAPPSIAAPSPTALAAGERVFVNLLQTWGTVAGHAEGQGTATVLVGEKRFTVPLKDLARRGEGTAPAAGIVERNAGKGRYTYAVPEIVTTTLDLRGQRAEAALAQLERFLDTAVLNGVARVSILHGKGTGRLADAVRKVLGEDRRVAAFGFAPLEQGGAGITEVTLSA